MADEQTNDQTDEQTNDQQPPADPKPSRSRKADKDAPPSNETEAQRINRALAEAAEEAEQRQADEMQVDPSAKVDGKPMESGGIYIVDGDEVDAFGRRVKR